MFTDSYFPTEVPGGSGSGGDGATSEEFQALSTKVDGIDLRVNNNATAIGTLQTTVKDQGTTLNTVQKNLADLTTTLGSMQTDILLLNTASGNNTAQITTLQNRVSTVDTKLNPVYSWYTNVLTEKFKTATPTNAWPNVLTSDLVQMARIQASANPDDALVNEGTLIAAIGHLATQASVDDLHTRQQHLEPKLYHITQTSAGAPMRLPLGTIEHEAFYRLSPTSGYTVGANSYDWACFWLDWPTGTEVMEFSVLNHSADRNVLVYCHAPDAVASADGYATFARGPYRNRSWSTAFLLPSTITRFRYHPADSQMFSRNGAWVPGFLEIDLWTDTSRTRQPVDDTVP